MSTCVEVDTMLLKIAHLSKMTSPAAYGEVPEIQVDGQVVLSNTPGFTVLAPDDKRTRFEKFGHLLNAAERTLFDKMTAQQQEFFLFQLEKKTSIGLARYKPVHSSVTSSWQEAKRI